MFLLYRNVLLACYYGNTVLPQAVISYLGYTASLSSGVYYYYSFNPLARLRRYNYSNFGYPISSYFFLLCLGVPKFFKLLN